MSLDRTHAVLVQVAELLKKLPADQIDALLAGEGRLAFIPTGARVAMPAAPKKPAALALDVDRVKSDLKSLNNRDAAAQYLKDLNLGKPQVVELANQLGVAFKSRDSADKIRGLIVEQKVGHRLESDAIFARKH